MVPGPFWTLVFFVYLISFHLFPDKMDTVSGMWIVPPLWRLGKSLAGYDRLPYLRLRRGARQAVNPYCVCHMHFCIWLSYLIFCNKGWRGGRLLLWFWIKETFRGATERKKASEKSCGATHLAAFFLSSVRLSSPTHLRKEGAEDVELCLLTSPCEQFGEWVGAQAKREGARLWQPSGQRRQNKWPFLSSRIVDVQGVNISIFGLRAFFFPTIHPEANVWKYIFMKSVWMTRSGEI